MNKLFGRFADSVSRWAGQPGAFLLAMASVVIWAATGPVFHYSETWQLVINTGTTIITFLMVFVIQNAQNRDGAAIQAKLDEIIRASASENAFIGIEHLSQEEVEAFRSRCEAAASRAEGAIDRANKRAAEAADRATGRS
jgi:low affinity Fe/Cu permease